MELLIEYYQELYSKYGYSPKSLGWDKGKQFLRFHQLTSEFKLNGASVLDVGCGFGDFVKYLQVNQIEEFRYTGVDLVEGFIKEARKIYAGDYVQFYQENFLAFEAKEGFDYGIASGTFNVKIEGLDGYDNIERNLKKMYQLCSKAVSIDLLTSRVDYTHPHNFNSDPLKILEMAYGLSKSVVLRNNYFPFEFSITIYKDDSFRKETTVFSEVERSFAWLGNK